MIKGALHIHSDISNDSQLSLRHIRDLFKGRGYAFIMTAEHAESLDTDRYIALQHQYDNLSDNDFLMIPGIEIKWKDKVHFLAYGAKKFMDNEMDLSLEDTIKRIRQDTGCELLIWGHFRHPSKITKEMYDALPLVDGLEIFNTMYHGRFTPDFSGLWAINSLRPRGHALLGIGGLDMHSVSHYNEISCVIEGLDELKKEKIFDFIRQGRFIIKGRGFNLKQSRYGALELAWSFIASIFNDYYRKVRRRLLAAGS